MPKTFCPDTASKNWLRSRIWWLIKKGTKTVPLGYYCYKRYPFSKWVLFTPQHRGTEGTTLQSNSTLRGTVLVPVFLSVWIFIYYLKMSPPITCCMLHLCGPMPIIITAIIKTPIDRIRAINRTRRLITDTQRRARTNIQADRHTDSGDLSPTWTCVPYVLLATV